MMRLFHEATVLVVDDDVTIRLLLSAGLGKQGFRVVEADSGEAGLAQFRSRRPDLVLIDVSMPGIDGYQLARMMRAEAAERAVPLVMLTGSDDPQTRRLGLEAGACEVLLKPFQLLPLAERLQALLSASA
ncbi:MAG: response regulator [Halomonas sp.]